MDYREAKQSIKREKNIQQYFNQNASRSQEGQAAYVHHPTNTPWKSKKHKNKIQKNTKKSRNDIFCGLALFAIIALFIAFIWNS